jgi:hypothetical protein
LWQNETITGKQGGDAMFNHYPDMNHDGKKDWFDGFLFHEMIREIEEKETDEDENETDDDDF